MAFFEFMRSRNRLSRRAMRIDSARELADRVLLIKRDLYRGASALDDGGAYLPDVRDWYRLVRLVRRPTIDATADSLREATATWLRSAPSPLAYAIAREGEEVRVLFGGSGEVQSAFHNRFPEAQFEECASPPLPSPYLFNGALVGCALDLSLIADSSELRDCYVACISDPFPFAELQRALEVDRENIAMLKPYISTREFDGSENHPVDIDVPRIREACALLEGEVDYLQSHDAFRRSVVRFGANTQQEFSSLCSLLDACIQQRRGGNPSSAIEGVHRYAISGSPSPLAVPLLVNPSAALGNIQGHALALQAVDDALAATCMPGLTGHPGYYVYAFGGGENTGDIFPIAPPMSGLPIGKIEGVSAYPMAVPMKQLVTHACVFGGTGTGKSSTIRTLLLQLYEKHVPFLVVESAKKEYCQLLGHIPELKIYGSGLDCHPLRLDPFRPEDGTQIATQISDISQAIYAMSGGESPLPQAIEMCVRLAYARKGWDANEAAFDDPGRSWPTCDDLLAAIPEVTGRYAQEVRMNLSAALRLRIEAIAGRLAGGEGMRMKELLSCPAVIELADCGEVAVFLALLLLKRMQAYLTKLPPSDELRGVCVLEESHNLFQKAGGGEGIQAMTNATLDKLLAEIRASGYGILLSEQRPSMLSDAVLANCGLRIAHSISSGTDLSLLRNSIPLTEEQAARLPYLAPGEALVSIRTKPPQRVRMNLPPTGSPFTAGCIICSERFRCRKRQVMAALLAADSALLRLRAGQLAAAPYDPRSVWKAANLLMADLGAEKASIAEKCCILGAALHKSGVSLGASRYILRSYERQLKGA